MIERCVYVDRQRRDRELRQRQAQVEVETLDETDKCTSAYKQSQMWELLHTPKQQQEEKEEEKEEERDWPAAQLIAVNKEGDQEVEVTSEWEYGPDTPVLTRSMLKSTHTQETEIS